MFTTPNAKENCDQEFRRKHLQVNGEAQIVKTPFNDRTNIQQSGNINFIVSSEHNASCDTFEYTLFCSREREYNQCWWKTRTTELPEWKHCLPARQQGIIM
jgi:hypothetical protein